MPVSINGNTGVVTGLAALPDSAMSSGSIIQVVQLNLDSGFSTTSVDFVDVTSASLSITTTGSNKVIVNVQAFLSNSAEHFYTFMRLLRGTTAIEQCVRMQDSLAASAGGNIVMSVLDSPSAGTHTYKLDARTENASHTAKVGIGANAGSRSTSIPDTVIQLMEVTA